MLFAARLVVHHAAVRSTRAAIVIADDDPGWYDPEHDQRSRLGGRHAAVSDVLAALARGGIGTRTGEVPGPGAGPRASRRSDVEVSAALILMPLAARPGDSIADALGSQGLTESARTTLEHLQVDLPEEVLARDASVTVSIRYRFECGIPLARRLVCHDAGARVLSDSATLTNQGAGYPYAGAQP